MAPANHFVRAAGDKKAIRLSFPIERENLQLMPICFRHVLDILENAVASFLL